MSEPDQLLAIYLHLARASQTRQRLLVRDKLLVLAAATAADAGLDEIAAFCRQRILEHNPGHMLGHFAYVSTALADERFQALLSQLLRTYPREKAEAMLASLGIDLANEGAAYFSQHEYAASLLGTTPDSLEAQFGDFPSDPPAQTPRGRPSLQEYGAKTKVSQRSGLRKATLLGLALAVGLLAALVAWLVIDARNVR